MGQSPKMAKKHMKTISFNPDNIGGVALIFAIPVSAFIRVKKDYVSGLSYVSVSSKDDIIQIPVINDSSFSFIESQSLESGGDMYAVKISGVIPRIDISDDIRRELERGEWMVMHADANGSFRISGSEDVPLIFSSSRSTGGSPSSLNGNSFSFSGNEPDPSEEVQSVIIIE